MGGTYHLPMQPEGEDKIIGGMLSLRQFTFLLVGFVPGAILGVILLKLTKLIFVAVLISLLPSILGAYMAFWRIEKHDMTADQYWRFRLLYQYRDRKYPYRQDRLVSQIGHSKGV
ncbi:PrgI family protein [Heliorestis acidaminivorans]|uniref:PrgI family protein n=1 Tax=Heliorestis acidaminivorans TaxID=553427 RepID=A0A6I0F4A6_9FIRM|nr:PrgI family protein [Heliorestis acidaminivorans]KAB2952000.1 PrgI family protein [Heliorestis acidaminivorans]